jgi:hypothetical protein
MTTQEKPVKTLKHKIDDPEREIEVFDEVFRDVVFRDVKRRKVKGNVRPQQDIVSLYAEDYALEDGNPEKWSPEKLDRLFEELGDRVESMEGVEYKFQGKRDPKQIGNKIGDQPEQSNEDPNRQSPKEQLKSNIAKQSEPSATVSTPTPTTNANLPKNGPIQPTFYGRKNPPKRVFPPADVPIKGDIPLQDLCSKWPNHLVGATLRRFIEDKWKPARIFVSMHPDAREAALAKRKGWEIILQRVEDEKKMAEEKALAGLEARKKVFEVDKNTTDASGSSKIGKGVKRPSRAYALPVVSNTLEHRQPLETPANQSKAYPIQQNQLAKILAKTTNGKAPIGNHNAPTEAVDSAIYRKQNPLTKGQQLGSFVVSLPMVHEPAPGGAPNGRLSPGTSQAQDNASTPSTQNSVHGDAPAFPMPPANASVRKSLSDHHSEVAEEVEKQRLIIGELLHLGPDWKYWSAQERNYAVHGVWVNEARNYETWLIAKHGISTSEIDFSKSQKHDILGRQGRLLWKVFALKDPLFSDATVALRQGQRERMMQKLYQKQLMILQSWRADWEAQVSGDKQRLRGAEGMIEQGLGQSGPTTSQAPAGGDSSEIPSPISLNPDPAQSYGKAVSNIPAQGSTFFGQAANNHLSKANNIGRQGDSAHSLHPQPILGGYGEDADRESPFDSTSDAFLVAGPYPQAQGSFPAVEHATSYPAPQFLNAHAVRASLMTAPKAATPAPTWTIAQPKKRGAPRLRMFPTKPDRDQPLSAKALTGNEEVMKEFPEHLSNTAVMQRFVKTAESKGWPTERMVDSLMRHPNAKDKPQMTREQRRANLKRWVIKERDTCHNNLRKAAETSPRKEVNPDDALPSTIQGVDRPTLRLRGSEVTAPGSIFDENAPTTASEETVENQHRVAEYVTGSTLGRYYLQGDQQIGGSVVVEVGPAQNAPYSESHQQDGHSQSLMQADSVNQSLNLAGAHNDMQLTPPETSSIPDGRDGDPEELDAPGEIVDDGEWDGYSGIEK